MNWECRGEHLNLSSELVLKLMQRKFDFIESPVNFFTVDLGEYILYYIPLFVGKEWRLHKRTSYNTYLLWQFTGNEQDAILELKTRGVI